jgi:tRNA(Arg) A34 adenosine deaminase TadA
MIPRELHLTLPTWISSIQFPILHTPDDRMRAAIMVARRNVDEATGGPFGALIIDDNSGEVIAAGVNIVVPSSAPIAHAEMMAIALACQAMHVHTLREAGSFALVTTVEPCAMCLGAVGWSGVSRVIIGARGEDAQAIGFDEGHKPHDWMDYLARGGVNLTRDVLRDDAAAVLRAYAGRGGEIYNGVPRQ